MCDSDLKYLQLGPPCHSDVTDCRYLELKIYEGRPQMFSGEEVE